MNRKYLLISFVAFTLAACKTDRLGKGECFSWLDIPPDYEIINPTDRRYYYWAPHYDPNNANEFVCLRGDPVVSASSLMVYNIQTNESKIVYTSPKIWNSPRWSKKDWLVFSEPVGLYKIKPDGDSITRLSFSGNIHFPTWNYDGTKIIYHTNEQQHTVEIINENGHLLQRLVPMTSIGVDWSINGLVASGTGSGSNQIKLINDSSYTITILDIKEGSNYYGICWLDNENIIYTGFNTGGYSSIYRINIHTQINKLIKQGCTTKSYNTVSVSSDRSKIITQTTEYTVHNSRKAVEGHSEIYTMNIDGSNETKIELPKY